MDYFNSLIMKLIVLIVFLNFNVNNHSSVIGYSPTCQHFISSNNSSTTRITDYYTTITIYPGLINLPPSLLLCRSSTYFFRPREGRSRAAVLVALLLLLGGVEVNPGPTVTMGSLNIRSGVNKAALLHSLIAEHRLELVALTETWAGIDDPPAILQDFAPSGYRVHHIPRPTSTRGKRGEDLRLLYLTV